MIANGMQPFGTHDRPMDFIVDDAGIDKENETPSLDHDDGQAKESVIQPKSGTVDNPIDLDDTDSDEEGDTNKFKCSKRRVPGASAQKGRKQAKKRPRQALKQLECDLILSPMKTRSRGNVRSTRGINR